MFVQLPENFTENYDHHLIEVRSIHPNGNSRQGKVLWSTKEAIEVLQKQLSTKTWMRDRNGDPRITGLTFAGDEFVAHYLPGRIEPGYGLSPAIMFVPKSGLRLSHLESAISLWLRTEDQAEIARANVAEFAPDVKPAPGRGEAIAKMLERRRQAA